MFEVQSERKQFLSAPPSVPATVAALMEPAIAVLCFALMHRVYGRSFDGASTITIILTLVLMFPGISYFGRSGIGVIIDIVASWGGVVLVLIAIAIATRTTHRFDHGLLRAWFIVTPCLQWLAVAIGTRILFSHMDQPGMRRRAVIVGANAVGVRLAQALKSNRTRGHEFVGYFDDRAAERTGLTSADQISGTLAGLPRFVDENDVKDVYITLPLSSEPRISKLMEMLQNTTASLHFVPDVFGVSIIQGRLEDLGGIPVVSLAVTPFTGVNGLLKRVSDILLSSCILAFIFPALALIALGVKMSSPGPVIFRQKRTGLDGEIIEVYKFRSMTVQDNGAFVRQATRNDSRVTKFGAFIRKTSLDELPQLVNVLQGQMSIVGPRPHAVAHNVQYRELVQAYMARHKVKPGITGWAQVNGLRGETDTLDKMRLRVEYDLEYLRNWSLRLDVLIILRTIGLVFFDRRAY